MSRSRRLFRHIASSSPRASFFTTSPGRVSISTRYYSTDKCTEFTRSESVKPTTNSKSAEEVKPKKKTQAELDRELQLKMQGMAGDGGDAGIEFEDGQPVSMKRSVKNNMFRYI